MEKDGGYEGLLAVQSAPSSTESDDKGSFAVTYLWCQNIRAQKEKDRWVVVPLGKSYQQKLEGWSHFPNFRCEDLPAFLYQGEAAGFTITAFYQSSFYVDSYETQGNWFSSCSTFDVTPQPNASLEGSFTQGHSAWVYYNGDLDDLQNVESLAVSMAPMEGDKRPALMVPRGLAGSGGSGGSSGKSWSSTSSKYLKEGERLVTFGGGGSGEQSLPTWPEAIALDFYLDEERVAQLTLPLKEGGPQ